MRLPKRSFPIALGILVVAAVTLVYSLNVLVANSRDAVYQEIQKVLGKDVAFDEFGVTLRSGLGFSAKRFRIADSPIFAATPLVQAQELRLGVSLLQLLLGRIVISKLTFVVPELQVITNEDGLLNLSSLASRRNLVQDLPMKRTTPLRREYTPVDFRISKVEIQDGRIDFIDRSIKAPAEMLITNVDLVVNGLNPSGRTRVTLAAALTEGLPQDVRVDGYLGPFVRNSSWKAQPVDIDVQFDSLFVPLLTRAVPFFRNKIPPELDVAGPLSFKAKLTGILERPHVTAFVLKAPVLGSPDYNATLSGSVDFSNNGVWSDAQVKGKLQLTAVNLARMAAFTFIKEALSKELTTDGFASIDAVFVGTWDTLRVGTIIRAEDSEIRYGNWLRKPAGTAAQWSAKLSRQKDRLIINDAVLTLGKSKFPITGYYDQAPQSRLQISTRIDHVDLRPFSVFVPALQSYQVKGGLHSDLHVSKWFAPDNNQLNIRGNATVTAGGLKGDHGVISNLNFTIAFLGSHARIDGGTFHLNASPVTVNGIIPELGRLKLNYAARTPDFDLADLPRFPLAKSDRLKDVVATGEVDYQEILMLRGSVTSPAGLLHDVPYRDLHSDVVWSRRGMSFKNVSFQALGGTVGNNAVWIAEDAQRLELNLRLESVDLVPLIKRKFPSLGERIDGRINFQGQFTAARQDGARVPSLLSGNGETRVSRGALKDLNLIGLLLSRAAAAGRIGIRFPQALAYLADQRDTPFETLDAHLILQDEYVRTDNLLLLTDDYSVSAAGWASLDGTSKWNGLLVLSSRITQELMRENKSLRYLLDRRGQLNIPFRAEGTLTNLKVRPDTRAIGQIIRRGSAPRTLEPPPLDKRPEKKEQKEWLPDELEHLLGR